MKSNKILLIRCYQKAGLLPRAKDITRYFNIQNLLKKMVNSSKSLNILIQ